ncbi:MAG: GEVED domain-containing protein [Patiriisocius sp.]|uniref:GEVED domain-containing protein n=1 Tax=Patiriisocius sp. TaxID=2822396 RepID=UPI003EF616F3
MKKITLLVFALFGMLSVLHAQQRKEINTTEQLVGIDNIDHPTETLTGETLYKKWKEVRRNKKPLSEYFSKKEIKILSTYLSNKNSQQKNSSTKSAACGLLDFPITVEPITLVDFAGINNLTDAAINGTPANEDFTSISGDVEQGMSYSITLEGNTNGNNINRFVVFVDWNQNEILDNTNEVYEITNTLINSTGIDGVQVTATIDVPAGANLGTTSMRVKKILGTTDYLNPCLGADNGQAEDYTINVNGSFFNEPRRYLIDSVDKQFAALGTIGSDISFVAPSPIASGENAGAIDPNDAYIGYVLDEAGNFYQVEVETGTYTLLGNLLSGWHGMEFDIATGVLYAITSTDLYIIDPNAITATLVGSFGFTNGERPIALGIDNGIGYIIDTEYEDSYSVDLSSGTATLLGQMFVDSDQNRMGDVAGMDGLKIVYTNQSSYRTAPQANLDPTTGSVSGGLVIGSLGLYNAEYGWYSYGQLFPDTSPCALPIFLDASALSGTEISFFWLNFDESDAVNGYDWEIYYKGEDPDTATASQSGHTPQFETFVDITGLTSGYFYDLYVTRDCGANGTSGRTTRVRIQTFLDNPECGIQNYFDRGGGNETYASKLDEANWTIYSDNPVFPENPGQGVEVNFLEFDLQDGHDVMYIYDGPNRFFPLIDSGQPETSVTGFPAGGYTGNTLPGTFRATHLSGALTFVLYTDDEYTDNTGWNATVNCFQLRPPNDLIVNAYDVDEISGFPYRDQNAILQYATEETLNPVGCSIFDKKGVWYKFVAEEDAIVYAEVVTPSGETNITFYSAPNENAIETDLTYVDQPTNYCDATNLSYINVEEGEAYYVYAINTEGETDIYMTSSTILGLADNKIEGFSYYPNPTSGVLTLNAMDNIGVVEFYNLLGQKMVSENVNGVSTRLNLSELKTGVYLMQVEVNGQTGTYKIVKE